MNEKFRETDLKQRKGGKFTSQIFELV